MIDPALLRKYNLPVPRYTSYPTVPYWQDVLPASQWLQSLQQSFDAGNSKRGLSLYLHLPFCESLCTYCGCNKKITTNHSVEEVYQQAILKEWKMYRRQLGARPIVRELHLGGGTPTFFSPANLARLLQAILDDCDVHPQHAFSFEGHPNNTTAAHLQTLYDLGFRRVSYGVQDHDPEVQRLINRIQPPERVQQATDLARQIGYTSVNFDLIYGLPLQNDARMERTISQSIAMRPDRVAFYSYAHVPWTSRGQRLFDEHDLPTAAEKMELYRLGKTLFTEAGYADIGMDHFALPGDELYKAWQDGSLHRNFMGYTTHNSALMLGLGVSAISDSGGAFAQNHKALADYYRTVEAGELPVQKGFILSEEDQRFRSYILHISCRGKLRFQQSDLPLLRELSFPPLDALAADGMLYYDEQGLELTPLGRHFIRNVCSAFDLHLIRNQAGGRPQFSKAI